MRQGPLVSTRYTTVNVIKTIEEILALGPIGLNHALAVPMSEVFDPFAPRWSYKAIVPDVLRTTKVPLRQTASARVGACRAVPRHSAKYWSIAMAGQDFAYADRADPVTYNRALWRGLKGVPYPKAHTGDDLRENRRALLSRLRTIRYDGCDTRRR